ncbi:DNA primase [Streptomyces phage Paradiddles]|uniref:DNA primase n=2 Tax=Samistivirus TaxID=2560220 RepID=A0A222YYI2_9CAUD|nr:DNA primase [Streptomyces phage NootNoot]YP_009611069.1 DNA primase [Streptomyces phage Paradiddles]UGL63076.1 DNA primase [Streptomyces phage Bartholomune]UOW93509.1 DNA primase [Streptomyces phage Squillium]WNM73340.1 DNA primase [Streptomyces phage Liandry]WNM74739.1 DNA primase [Streptomyces phage PinkiePie]ASR77341.1 DNA primase [Streptomyces phage NootNoot]
MGNTRDNQWATSIYDYTEEQIAVVIQGIGVEVDGETGNDFLCYCPFHGNTDTPSFSVSKRNGTYICFNAACAEQGNLTGLVQRLRKCNMMEALRFVMKHKDTRHVTLAERREKRLARGGEFNIFPDAPFERMYNDFWEYPEAVRYMVEERGFEEETLHHFKIGYSAKNDMVIVPMHSPDGQHVGLIGRSIEGKRFKNSPGLPVSRTLWNLNRAKAAGDAVVITEASFDSMRVHQAGYPCTVALLGGHLSLLHIELLNRYFNTLIIMTDFDDKSQHISPVCKKCRGKCEGHNPGRDLGKLIVDSFPRKRVLWASHGYKEVYPDSAKDPGMLSDKEIKTCVQNAVSNFEYRRWGLY